MICGIDYTESHTWKGIARIRSISGIWYEAHVPFEDGEVKPQPGAWVIIYHHITEKSQALYGFKTLDDRELFKHLLSVDGIGPTAGMKLLRNYEPEKIRIDIADKDVANLSKAKSIGAKTAQKIIDKLAKKFEEYKTEGVTVGDAQFKSGLNDHPNQAAKEAVVLAKKGLIKLGFKVRNVETVVNAIVGNMFSVALPLGEKIDGNDLAARILKYALEELKG